MQGSDNSNGLVRAEALYYIGGPIYLGGASYSVSGSPTGSSGYGSR